MVLSGRREVQPLPVPYRPEPISRPVEDGPTSAATQRDRHLDNDTRKDRQIPHGPRWGLRRRHRPGRTSVTTARTLANSSVTGGRPARHIEGDRTRSDFGILGKAHAGARGGECVGPSVRFSNRLPVQVSWLQDPYQGKGLQHVPVSWDHQATSMFVGLVWDFVDDTAVTLGRSAWARNRADLAVVLQVGTRSWRPRRGDRYDRRGLENPNDWPG
jgi:hypothetical protein